MASYISYSSSTTSTMSWDTETLPKYSIKESVSYKEPVKQTLPEPTSTEKALLDSEVMRIVYRTLMLVEAETYQKEVPHGAARGIFVYSRRNPLLPDEEVSKAASFSIAIILYLLDNIDDVLIKANIIREALTSLIIDFDPALKIPQVLIFSRTMHADELLDLAMYAGAASAWENKFENFDGVCISASLHGK